MTARRMVIAECASESGESYSNGKIVYNRAHIDAGGACHLQLEHGVFSSISAPFSSAFTSRSSELLPDSCGSCVTCPGDVGSTVGAPAR